MIPLDSPLQLPQATHELRALCLILLFLGLFHDNLFLIDFLQILHGMILPQLLHFVSQASDGARYHCLFLLDRGQVVDAIVDELGSEDLTLGQQLCDQLCNELGALLEFRDFGFYHSCFLFLDFQKACVVHGLGLGVLAPLYDVVEILKLLLTVIDRLENLNQFRSAKEHELDPDKDLDGLLIVNFIDGVNDSLEEEWNAKLVHQELQSCHGLLENWLDRFQLLEIAFATISE